MIKFIKQPKYFFLFLFISSTFSTFAQFNNEWIDFSKQYLKVGVSQTGIYRVSYNDLIANGAPAGTTERSTIKFFHKGKEIAVKDNFSGNVASSYFEFYGQKNDGFLDAQLYGNDSIRANTKYSLFTDSTFYFINWGGVVGKRIDSYSPNSGSKRINSVIKDSLRVYNDGYNIGSTYYYRTYLSTYDAHEGWMGTNWGVGTVGNTFIKLATPKIVKENPSLKINFKVASTSSIPIRFYVGVGKNRQNITYIDTVDFKEFSNKEVFVTVSDSSLVGTDSVIVAIYNDINTSYFAPTFFQYSYNKSIENQIPTYFSVLPASGDYLSFPKNNANNSSLIYDISDVINLKYVQVTTTDSIRIYPTQSTNESKYVYWNSTPLSSYSIGKANFKQISTKSKKPFVLVSHIKLTEPADGSQNPVQSYASYRASTAGGSYDTIVAYTHELYDQFTFGQKTPLAIKLLCKYLSQDTTNLPSNLFLLGKSYDFDSWSYRKDTSSIRNKLLVPTMGTPGSDVLFSWGILGRKNYNAIPTGRISASTSQEVMDYLGKVQEHEALKYDALWRKNMIHLSGGTSASEIEDFKNVVNGLKSIAKGKYIGAKIDGFSKSSTDFQTFNISENVNQGASVITFFGHSSPTYSDIDIGRVDDPVFGYNNKGKYPIILMHGCNSGNPFSDNSFAENWLETPDKGAIAFIGNTGYAYAHALNNQAVYHYQIAFGDSLGIEKTIGEIHKEVAKKYNPQNDEIDLTQVQQSVLQGDPAIVVFGPKYPDYAITDNDIFIKSFDNKTVTALSDSFAVGIVISNFGKFTSEKLSVSIDRTYNGNIVSNSILIDPIGYKDTVYFHIKSKDMATLGQNSIKVTLNFTNELKELSTTNNVATYNFIMPSSGVNCIYPKEFSVINKPSVSLYAQPADQLSAARDYVFEIDTTHLFNSTQYQTFTTNASNLVKWHNVDLFKNLPPTSDSEVFFWRVKFKNVQGGEVNTVSNSSFTYIKNSKEGWSQGKFEQLINNEFSAGLIKDTTQKKFSFEPVKLKFEVQTSGASATGGYANTTITIGGFPQIFNGKCNQEGMVAIAFDRTTLKQYNIFSTSRALQCLFAAQGFVNMFSNLAPSPSAGSYREYSRPFFAQFVDSVKNGDYVLLVSSGNCYFSSWRSGNTIPPFQKFLDVKLSQLGCSKLSMMKDGYPYICLGQKGGKALIELVPDTNGALLPSFQMLNMDYTLESSTDKGEIKTEKIGPAKEWGNFYRQFASLEKPSKDELKFDVIGYTIQGKEVKLLADTALADGFSLKDAINSKIYPYISLVAKVADKTNLTPPQLKKLQVLFDKTPEGVLLVDGLKYTGKVTKQEGDSLVLEYKFLNISDLSFESPFKVNYNFSNNNKLVASQTDSVSKVLAPDSSFTFKKVYSTLNKVGYNISQVYANQQYQFEQSYENNSWVLDFDVIKDQQNPVLDVLIDGNRIINGEVVRPNPEIQIVVKDENKFMLKKDTIGLDVYLRKCESCSFERISIFNNTAIEIIYPSQSSNNQLTIKYLPQGLADGKYTLRVQTADQTGNKSGIVPYQIDFVVESKSAVSNFYPYPNPFSNAMRFAYTLNGAVVPDQVKIQIMTATGKVVREITQDELGPLKSGSHLTDFVWNGTDEFGDKLANGVYFYKVTMKANGNDIEKLDSAGDKAFKKDWGKLYILR